MTVLIELVKKEVNMYIYLIILAAYIISVPFVYGILKVILASENNGGTLEMISMVWPAALPIVALFICIEKYMVIPVSGFSEHLCTQLKNWKSRPSSHKKGTKDSDNSIPSARIHKNG